MAKILPGNWTWKAVIFALVNIQTKGQPAPRLIRQVVFKSALPGSTRQETWNMMMQTPPTHLEKIIKRIMWTLLPLLGFLLATNIWLRIL